MSEMSEALWLGLGAVFDVVSIFFRFEIVFRRFEPF